MPGRREPDDAHAGRDRLRRIGLFTDALPDRPLPELLGWLQTAAPCVTRIEIGTGGYSRNGMLESRMPGDPTLMPWNFSTVGRGDGRPVAWWTWFVATLAAKGFDGTISIEFEDPFVPVEDSIVEAANALEAATCGAGVFTEG